MSKRVLQMNPRDANPVAKRANGNPAPAPLVSIVLQRLKTALLLIKRYADNARSRVAEDPKVRIISLRARESIGLQHFGI